MLFHFHLSVVFVTVWKLVWLKYSFAYAVTWGLCPEHKGCMLKSAISIIQETEGNTDGIRLNATPLLRTLSLSLCSTLWSGLCRLIPVGEEGFIIVPWTAVVDFILSFTNIRAQPCQWSTLCILGEGAVK